MKKLLFIFLGTLIFQFSQAQALNDNIGSGNCLDFDGVNNFVGCGDIVSGTFDGINSTITLEVWANVSVTGGSQHLVSKYNSSDGTETFLFPINAAGQLSFLVFTDGSNFHFVTSTETIPTDEWVHLAITADLMTATFNLYLNGVALTLNSAPGGTPPTAFRNTNAPFDIGSVTNSIGSRQNYTGQMDEVRVWNVVRTQTEIRDNMCKQLTGSEAGLIGYWNMNEGIGNMVNDLTVNGNDGTLQ